MPHVNRHSSELGRWEMIHREGDPRFGNGIREYCGWWEHCPGTFRRIETPSRNITLILSFGPEIRVRGADEPDAAPRAVSSFVAGMHRSAVLTEHGGNGHGVEVTLSPPFAHRVLRVPMHELTQRIVDLRDALGAPGERLLDCLVHAPSWESRFTLLDRFFAGRLERSPPPSLDVAWAWNRLEQTDGRVKIRSLAQERGWSQKRLIACFREQIGLRPKDAARVLRFDRAARLLAGNEPAELASIALDAGYCDQAHFNRDFRAFAGLTPSEFLARRLPAGGGIAGA